MWNFSATFNSNSFTSKTQIKTCVVEIISSTPEIKSHL